MTKLDFLRRSSAFSLASVLILHSAFTVADDTEVFFGGQPGAMGAKPNVLFLLDNSGSMAWRLDSDSDSLNGTPSRMDVLKQSFKNIMTNTGNINVGVMVLNERSRYGNTRTLHPVEFIDKPMDVNITSTPEILASADDATRINSGSATDIASPTLVMGSVSGSGSITRNLGSGSIYSNNNSSYYIKDNYSCSVKIATARDNCDTGAKTTLNARQPGGGGGGQDGLFLFRNLNIPAGSTITSAALTITPSADNSTKPGMNISLEDSKAPAAYNDATTISDRSFTATSNLTANGGKISGTWTKDSSFVIDITSEISSLLGSAPATNPIADLGLKLRANSGSSNYNYYVGDHVSAPSLTITYTAPAATTRSTALRFQNVGVPQGAVITSARIDFVPAGSDDRPVTFNVTAENAVNANAFSTGENFTGRSKTSSTIWSPAEWRTENPAAHVEGPSVIDQVQAVVNQGGWCGNNAMAFFLEHASGNGSRIAHSYDGQSSLKPVLRITYEGGENGCFNPLFETGITADKNDGRQYTYQICILFFCTTHSTVVLNENSMSLNSSATTYVAARYENMPVIRGATVEKAELIITRASGNASASVDVAVEDTGNSGELNTTSNNISSRFPSSAAFSCNLSGTETICASTALNSALQKVFAKGSWNDGNALSIILKSSSQKDFSIAAYDGDPGSSVRLRIKLGNGGMKYRTVRSHIDNEVQAMSADGGTPLVPAMHEAALYLSEKYHKGSNPSPITSSCQATHLVVLTDGKPEGTNTDATNDISIKAGGCANVNNLPDAKCGVELARWLATTDQTSFKGDSYINTHTVGFALNARPGAEGIAIRKFLADTAAAGGGGYYSAENATDLSKVFNQILQQVLATDTTFVSATAPVNSLNRKDHKNEAYFSVFRPATTDRWAGNLKRYGLKNSSGSLLLVDADDISAIDTSTGNFRNNARSWWSSSNDGNNVTEGGAARKLTNPDTRKLLTNVTTGTALTEIKTSNTALTQAMLGVTDATDRENLIKYIRGYDSNNTIARQAMGDPIHSTPTVVSYGCVDAACSSEAQSVIVGTNEGFVQLFNTNTGEEQAAFMPRQLLTNIKRLRANEAMNSNPHIYGMDNTVTVWSNDVNKDGKISGSDFVYAYATMGRGGNGIYALDITTPTSPKLLWSKTNADTGYTKLGQTWSAPVKGKIKVGNTITDVLIFGGGYDPAQDGKTTRSADGMGNDLFIVNAVDGRVLWSASAAEVGMQYSVPSKVKVTSLHVDNGIPRLNPEGLVEQIFVGDMGGQVWRIRINNGQPEGSGLASGNLFASLGGAGAADNRRFYHEPELALVSVENQLHLTVNIGSGFRGHPLDNVIADRFYSLRTSELDGGGSPALTESALYDATALVTATDAQREVMLQSPGWFIRLTRAGEKVLSSALAMDGVLYFNTYQPKANTDECTAAQGVSNAYRVKLLDGTAVNNTRSTTIKGASLPSNPQLFCQGDTCWVYNDPSNLIPTNRPACPVGQKCDDECLPGEACAVDVSTQSRLYWADEED